MEFIQAGKEYRRGYGIDSRTGRHMENSPVLTQIQKKNRKAKEGNEEPIIVGDRSNLKPRPRRKIAPGPGFNTTAGIRLKAMEKKNTVFISFYGKRRGIF